MEKFTKIAEEFDNQKFYQIDVQVKLTVRASSEGEAAYLADSSMASIKSRPNDESDYSILKIDEIQILPGNQK